MADSPPVYQFELNCLFTERDANLSQVQFKELNIESTFDPHFLRDALWDRDLIWYTERKSIYFLGNDRELRRILNEAELKTGATRLVPFEEMYSERQPILRFLLYSGLDRLMRAKGFLPTITRGDHVYYPYSVSTPDTPLTHAVTQSAARIIVKKGVIFDLDTSVEGQGLLWIDMKLVTFVHLGTPLSFGRPVYIMCEKRQDCTAGDHEILREGAFVSEEAPLDASALPCLSGKTGDSLLVRTKVRGKFIRVPNACAYTTVGTRTLKELGVYSWWREKAIPSSEERYAITWQIINLLGDQSKSLVIRLPDNQKIIFGLQRTTTRAQMRFVP